MENQQFNNETYSNPKYWKWGIFYYNKNDKRIFPPKKTKQLGWTVNFANPISIFTLIALVLIIYLVAYYFKLI